MESPAGEGKFFATCDDAPTGVRLNAAATAFRAQILRKQVFAADDIGDWTISGVFDSVYELRDGLVRALVGLRPDDLVVVEQAVLSFVQLLLALRKWSHSDDDEERHARLGDHEPAMEAYVAWRTSIEAALTTLEPKKTARAGPGP